LTERRSTNFKAPNPKQTPGGKKKAQNGTARFELSPFAV
jgi:hypothetical protein